MAFTTFLAKEFEEIVRTWRIWVIPGLILFFGVTSPVIALVTPALVSSLSGEGVVIELPDPTAIDAMAQFLKNLNQIVLLAVIIAGAGAITSERRSGTAALVLVKPLSRASFVVAKLCSHVMLLVAATVVGTGVCLGMTMALFGGAPALRFVMAVALWTIFAVLMTAVMVLLSSALDSQGAAAGAGLALLFVALLLSAWPPLAHTTFVGLPGQAGSLLAGEPVVSVLPIGTGILAGLIAAGGAIVTFRRKEL